MTKCKGVWVRFNLRERIYKKTFNKTWSFTILDKSCDGWCEEEEDSDEHEDCLMVDLKVSLNSHGFEFIRFSCSADDGQVYKVVRKEGELFHDSFWLYREDDR